MSASQHFTVEDGGLGRETCLGPEIEIYILLSAAIAPWVARCGYVHVAT